MSGNKESQSPGASPWTASIFLGTSGAEGPQANHEDRDEASGSGCLGSGRGSGPETSAEWRA